MSAGHGPEPCEDCGVLHTPPACISTLMVTRSVSTTGAETRFVTFYGFTADGFPLYVDASHDEVGR